MQEVCEIFVKNRQMFKFDKEKKNADTYHRN